MMKRTLFLGLCVLMLLSMLCLMTGCGAEDQFVGSWKGTIDMTKMIDDELKANPSTAEMASYFNFENFAMDVVYTFNEDGTYSVAVDDASVAAMVADYRKGLADGLTKYFEDYLKKNNVNMTVDALLKASNTTLDAMVDDAVKSADLESSAAALEENGVFYVLDEVLYTAPDDDGEESAYYYSFPSETELLFSEENVTAEVPASKYLFPMSLKKQ